MSNQLHVPKTTQLRSLAQARAVSATACGPRGAVLAGSIRLILRRGQKLENFAGHGISPASVLFAKRLAEVEVVSDVEKVNVCPIM